ncbi:MAG: hypothetical protein H3C51_09875 [Rubellimicrobium sp.]|nr:hypothetical protein [Rubellimicrobium sp.]
MWGFIVAIIGGLVVAPAEDLLAKPVARLVAPVVKIEDGEIRALSLVIVLLIVGIIAELIHSGTPFWVILGATIGLFGQRLFNWARAAVEKRRG